LVRCRTTCCAFKAPYLYAIETGIIIPQIGGGVKAGILTTEAEWEYAARGPDGLVFPWGDGFKGSLLNACDRGCEWNLEGSGVDDGYAETAPVGSFPGGASWVGAMDMSGNVWEWTSSIYGAYGADGAAAGGSRRVLRGGSWYHTGTDLLRSAARYGVSPEYADYVTGFRCVGSWQ
jgi:formylglycine-generating enzyme required for sulfatase activity